MEFEDAVEFENEEFEDKDEFKDKPGSIGSSGCPAKILLSGPLLNVFPASTLSSGFT